MGLLVITTCAVAGVFGARWLVDRLSTPECVFVAAGQSVSLTPEQAANAATIAAVSVQRGLPPRAATIGLTTAIQESKLRNLRYGHADSQGLFQQRPSQGWGTVEQVTDPVYASNAFYDALERVAGWQEGVVTVVAQEVQRSAFPDAYADHEWEGRILASVLTGQEGSATQMGCDLDAPTAAGSAKNLSTKLQQQLGVADIVDAGSDAATLTLLLDDGAHAWAAATWLVSHAEAEQVVSVQVAGQRWDRDRSPLTWRPAQHAAADAADLPSSGRTTVVVELN